MDDRVRARLRCVLILLVGIWLVALLLPSERGVLDRAFAATGNYLPDEFVTVWKTDNPGVSDPNQLIISTFTISGAPYVYNFKVDWGDGTSNSGLTGHTMHTYASPGTYTVKITGKFPSFIAGDDGQKLLSVEQWGNNKWETTAQAFYGAINAQINAHDVPDLSGVTHMNMMFYGARSFNSDISKWDVSHVVSMTEMFSGAAAFNKPLNDWNVGSVQQFGNMFYGAASFNQPLDKWNVSQAQSLRQMFVGASAFDQSLATWDVRKVTTMEAMFNKGIAHTGYPNVGDVVIGTSGISTENYDDTLIAWSGLALRPQVNFGAGTSTYCNAEEERASIISTFSWTIYDGGPVCVPTTTPQPTNPPPTVTHPVTTGSTPATTVPAPTVTVAPEIQVGGIHVSLPVTGQQTITVIFAAVVLLAGGCVSVIAARRARS